jgi:hypothetical protein
MISCPYIPKERDVPHPRHWAWPDVCKTKVHEINTVRVKFSVKWRGMATMYHFTAGPQDVARGCQ